MAIAENTTRAAAISGQSESTGRVVSRACERRNLSQISFFGIYGYFSSVVSIFSPNIARLAWHGAEKTTGT